MRGRGVYARRGRAFFVGAIYFVLDSGRLRGPNLKFKPLFEHYAGRVIRRGYFGERPVCGDRVERRYRD